MSSLIYPENSQTLRDLRQQYLDSLSEPQDFYSESLIKPAAFYLLYGDGLVAGYGAIGNSGTLLEFFCTDARRAGGLFDEFVRTHNIENVLCKTFDPLVLSLCLDRARSRRVVGYVFTEYAETEFASSPTIAHRLAEAGDLARILVMHDGFFDSAEEVLGHIRLGSLHLYEKAGELAGCGLLQNINAHQATADLGMVINMAHQRKGLGQYIVRHLKRASLAKNLRPLCCCDVENLASRACLEAAGFRTRHRLVEFELDGQKEPFDLPNMPKAQA